MIYYDTIIDRKLYIAEVPDSQETYTFLLPSAWPLLVEQYELEIYYEDDEQVKWRPHSVSLREIRDLIQNQGQSQKESLHEEANKENIPRKNISSIPTAGSAYERIFWLGTREQLITLVKLAVQHGIFEPDAYNIRIETVIRDHFSIMGEIERRPDGANDDVVNQDLTSNSVQRIRLKAYLTTFLYLVYLLINERKIPASVVGETEYGFLEEHFIDRKGNAITSDNMVSVKSNVGYYSGGKPRGSGSVEKIITEVCS